MKKFKFFIFSIFSLWLLFNHCFWYDVIIYGPNNELVFMYPVEEGTTEITLEGNRSKDWNNFTFLDWYYWTDVFYVDWYWKDQKTKVVSDLYINWNNSISYTWEQYLSLTDSDCWTFEGYTPTFDVTWTIQEVSESWNIFTNFAQNSLQVLLSNVPNYIQYIIIIMLLFFVLGIIRKIKWRR